MNKNLETCLSQSKLLHGVSCPSLTRGPMEGNVLLFPHCLQRQVACHTAPILSTHCGLHVVTFIQVCGIPPNCALATASAQYGGIVHLANVSQECTFGKHFKNMSNNNVLVECKWPGLMPRFQNISQTAVTNFARRIT